MRFLRSAKHNLRMRNELYARNPNMVYIFLLSTKICNFIPQYIIDFSPLLCLKKALENGNPNAHVVCGKHFYNMLVLHSSAEFLSSQIFVYLKFIYLLIFILHIINKYYSYTIYLRISFNFQNL